MANHDPQETDHKVLHHTHQEQHVHHKPAEDDLRAEEDVVTEEVVVEKTAAEVPPPRRTPSMSTPRIRQTTLTTDLEPERSPFGTYLSVIGISLLLIFGLWQFFSKAGMRAQIAELQRENASLKEQVAQLQNQPAAQAIMPSQPDQPIQPAQAEPAISPVVTGYYPVLYRNSIRQQIGQFITSPTNTNLTAVTLRGNSGLGDNAELAIFETNDPTQITETERPAVSKLFNASQVPVGQSFAVQLDSPYSLRKDKKYFIVLRPSSTNAKVNVGYNLSSASTGQMWVYTRKINTAGQVIDSNPSWQLIPNASLTADLQISE